MEVSEGGVEIEVPDDVFYNPNQELNRDLTVAVLRAFREWEPRAETYLDAMAATGVRGVRAAADGWRVTCCDRDERAVELCRSNLARNDLEAEAVRRDVNAFLHESVFDVVDLDPFGTPIPFADAAFANARNLVCVTATDTAPLCGAHFKSGVRKYGAIPRNTDYHPEMGLRVLLSALARTAARYDVGVTPLASHATRHYVRTYLELSHGATDADEAVDALGHLYHCEDCLYRESESGLLARSFETCPNCGGERTLVAGPVWLGPYRDRTFVERAGDRVSGDMGTAGDVRDLTATLADELDEPTHYDHHRLCKQWRRPAEKLETFLDRLRDGGFDASRAHYGGTSFKTTASVAEMERLLD